MPNSLNQTGFDDALYLADVGVSTTADEMRNLTAMSLTPGRRTVGSFKVTQHAGTPGMSIDIGPGMACVPNTFNTDADATTGLYADGVYVVRLRSLVTVTISTAPTTTARKDYLWLRQIDKTVQGGTLNETQLFTQPSTTTAPKSAIKLAEITVGVNVTSIVNANIDVTIGTALAGPPLLPGYVDKATTDLATSIAPKRVSKLARGSQPVALGTTIKAVTMTVAGFNLATSLWTTIPFNNSDPNSPLKYNLVNILDDGELFGAAGQHGFQIPTVGFYRLSCCFGLNTTPAGAVPPSNYNFGLRAIEGVGKVASGRTIASIVQDASDIGGSNPLTISQTFYWDDITSNELLIQLYQNSGKTMLIPGQTGGIHAQVAILEKLT